MRKFLILFIGAIFFMNYGFLKSQEVLKNKTKIKFCGTVRSQTGIKRLLRESGFNFVVNGHTNGCLGYRDSSLRKDLMVVLGKLIKENDKNNMVLFFYSCSDSKTLKKIYFFWPNEDVSKLTLLYNEEKNEIWFGNDQTDSMAVIKWDGKTFKRYFRAETH